MNRLPGGGRRLSPSGSPGANQNQTWTNPDHYGATKLFNPNAMMQPPVDNNLYQPNLQNFYAQPQPVNADYDPAQGSAQPTGHANWDWSNGTQQQSTSDNNSWSGWNYSQQQQLPMGGVQPVYAPQQHHNAPQQQFPQYQQQQQPLPHLQDPQQQQTSWDPTRPSPAVAMQQPNNNGHYDDVWNWGASEEQNEDNADAVRVAGGQVDTNNGGVMSQELRPVPDGQDQWGYNYQNWSNSQTTSYSWPQQTATQQPHQQAPAEPRTNYQQQPLIAGVDEPRSQYEGGIPGWEVAGTIDPTTEPRMAGEGTMDEGAQVSADQESTPTSTDPQSHRQEALGGAATLVEEPVVDGSDSVATYFRQGEKEEGEGDAEDEDVEEVPPAYANAPADSSQPNLWGRVPYLRCDSWMSNSSLLTYNRSTAGSQECLSGSFYGGDEAGGSGSTSVPSLAGLCRSVDDFHLSSPQSLPYTTQHHPLHLLHQTHLVGSSAPRRRNSIEEHFLRAPVETTSQEEASEGVSDEVQSNDVIGAHAVASVASNQEVVAGGRELSEQCLAGGGSTRQSSDAANTNSAVVTTFDHVHPEQSSDLVFADGTWNQDSTPNLEVPPSTEPKHQLKLEHAPDGAASVGSSNLPATENVEVVASPGGSPGGGHPAGLPVWSRDGSAFQPPPQRTSIVTPVIQREILDDATAEAHPDATPAFVLPDGDGANLETVPDNVEQPLDLDVSEKLSPIRSPKHNVSVIARHRLGDARTSSPSTTLWENPDVTRDFGLGLAPATSTSKVEPQSAIVVPQLHNQQELLDNPLGPVAPAARPVKLESVTDRLSTNRSTAAVLPVDRSVNPGAAPLDLSSRSAPQGRSSADDLDSWAGPTRPPVIHQQPGTARVPPTQQISPAIPAQHAVPTHHRSPVPDDRRPNLPVATLDKDANRQSRPGESIGDVPVGGPQQHAPSSGIEYDRWSEDQTGADRRDRIQTSSAGARDDRSGGRDHAPPTGTREDPRGGLQSSEYPPPPDQREVVADRNRRGRYSPPTNAREDPRGERRGELPMPTDLREAGQTLPNSLQEHQGGRPKPNAHPRSGIYSPTADPHEELRGGRHSDYPTAAPVDPRDLGVDPRGRRSDYPLPADVREEPRGGRPNEYPVPGDLREDPRGRRGEYPPPAVDPRDERDRYYRGGEYDYGRGGRERSRVDDRYSSQYASDDPALSDRERSRPSSRTGSVHEYGSRSERDRYYDRERGRPQPPVDPRGGAAWSGVPPPRPQSRGGYDSDTDGSGRGGAPRQSYDPYNTSSRDYYQRDPRYSGYDYYNRYPREHYDPRAYQAPYYGANQYNYGYYAELYGSDPRYQAYYDYYQQYNAGRGRAGSQYGYDDSDRRSVHSGRSSVTNDSQNGRESPNQESITRPLADQSTIYPVENTYYTQEPSNETQYSEQATGLEVSVSNDRLTPAKFSLPHMRASFGQCGRLVILHPSNVVDNQVAAVEICDLQSLCKDDAAIYDVQSFNGPLVKGETHKNDVIQYCLQKVRKAKQDTSLTDRDSCALIWELLVLLIRQNGVVVGTDISELLLKDRQLVDQKLSPVEGLSPSDSIDHIPDGVTPDEGVVVTHNFSGINSAACSEKHDTDKFIELLLFGHKKDALEWATKHGLWGHALFLASKMDSRTYAMVMTRFANSLPFNDPLQTLYQLMSGRQPASVTCIADEKWGDWRPHLAMILSNSTQRPDLDRRSVITLGDTLAGRGCLHAAHFCYIMAQMEFGNYSKKTSKLVLIGSNHSLPFNHFATEEAIHCTEIYEYVQSLANNNFVLPHLQFYKYIYATRLAEWGYPQEALHYCEVVASAIQQVPASYDVEFAHLVYNLSYRLKYYDPYYTQEDGEVVDLGDPMWLRSLAQTLQCYEDGLGASSSEYTDQMQSGQSQQSYQNDYQAQTPVTPSDSQLPSGGVQQYQTNVIQGQEHVGGTDVYQNQNSGYTDNDVQQTGSYLDYSNLEQSPAEADVSADQQQSYYNEQSYYGDSGGTTNYSGQVASNLQSNEGYNYEYNDLSANTNSAQQQADVSDYYANVRKNSLPLSPAIPSSGTPNLGSSKPQSTFNNSKALATVKEKPTAKKPEEKTRTKQGSSWLGGIFSKFSLKPKNQMILPDDKDPTIVWDPDTGKWVNTDMGEEEVIAASLPPPKDVDLSKSSRPATMGAPSPLSDMNSTNGPPTANHFKRKPGKGMRQNYVDVLGGNTVPAAAAPLAPNVFPGMDSSMNQGNFKPQFFIPQAVPNTGDEMTDFVTSAEPFNQAPSRVANPGSRGGSPQEEGNVDDGNKMSRSSSQSSLSREVQSYMTPYNASSADAAKEENVHQQLPYQQQPQQPMMFNPSMMANSAPTATPGTAKGGLSRYGTLRYPR